MKKHNKTHRSRRILGVKRLNRALIFTLLFGLLAVIIGLSQIFAQSSVVFLFSPTTQSANANENKSFTISLNGNGQQVDGGSVAITYDADKVSFTAFTNPASPGVGTSNKFSSPGRYSYDFQISSGSQGTTPLGTITLKAGSLSSAQAAHIGFESGNTKAYLGVNSVSRSYYPAALGQAAMIVNASAPATTTTPPATQNPPSNSNPVTNQPANNQQSTNQNPQTPSQNPDGQNLVTEPFNVDYSGFNSSSSNGDTNDFANVAASPRHKSSLGIFLLIGGGILLAGSAAILFLKFKQANSQKHRSAKGLHTSILDEGNPASDSEDDENIVIKPDTAKHHDKPAQADGAAREYPAIITKHASHKPAHEPVKEPVSDKAAEQPKPRDNTPTVTQVKESTDKTHHKEVEVDIVRLKPADAIAETVLAKLADPKPILTDQLEVPAQVQPPAVPPAAVPAPAPIPARTPVRPSPAPVQRKDAAAASQPPARVPDWQSHLTGRPGSTPDENPKDMFELAEEHPETFGSQALAEDPKDTAAKKETK